MLVLLLLATNRLPVESNARPRGAMKPDAIVLTTPPGVTRDTLVVMLSDTRTLPAASTVTPTGRGNVAKVLTTPPGVTFSTEPDILATYRFPAESKATPAGSPRPDAKVLTTPPGVTLLTMPLFPLLT